MNHDTEILWHKFGAQTTIAQAKELYDAVINSPSGPVVEIGSASGGTTIVLVMAAMEVDKIVYSIDPYPVEMEGIARDYAIGEMTSMRLQFRENLLSGKYNNIIQINKSLEDCINEIPCGISVTFIDGLHELSAVKLEYKLLYPKMAKGGIMYFHDMGYDAGQLTESGRLDKFPAWVKKGHIVDQNFNSRLEYLRQMLKIVV